MIRREHTFFYIYNTIHDFKSFRKKDKIDIVRGKYHLYKCANCGIIGKRYTGSIFISIAKQYSQEKLGECKMENVKVKKAGIFIRIIESIKGFRKEKGTKRTNNTINDEHLKVGSVHKIIDTEGKKQHNDLKGVWVDGVKKPVKVANIEFEIAAKSKRTAYNKKKSNPIKKINKTSKRTKW